MILAEIDANVIIVFVAMIIAGLKALIEKRNQQNQPPPQEEDQGDYEDLYEAYEAEIEAQRAQLQIPVAAPPPLPTPVPVQAPASTPQPKKVVTPTLSAAEEEALERFNSRSDTPQRKKNKVSTKARVKAHLSSPTAAREALLLAEVLGPPKALK